MVKRQIAKFDYYVAFFFLTYFSLAPSAKRFFHTQATFHREGILAGISLWMRQRVLMADTCCFFLKLTRMPHTAVDHFVPLLG
jgi:hypothetical protein